MANAVVGFGVSDFVLISTDKAVRPTNVMGASKRVAEMLLQAIAVRNSSKICNRPFWQCARLVGIGVPRFNQQINSGGLLQ